MYSCLTKLKQQVYEHRSICFVLFFKYSTTHAVVKFTGDTILAMDNKEYTVWIFFYISMAFGTIDHDIILFKLNHYRIRGLCLECFCCYLEKRPEYVQYNDTESVLLNITFVNACLQIY